MRFKIMLPLVIITSGVLGIPEPLLAQLPPGEGTWALSYRVFTKAGGETVKVGNATNSPWNLRCVIGHQGWRVAEDGSLAWEYRGGRYHSDDVQTYPVGTSSTGWVTATAMLKATGKLTGPTLKVQLQWTGADGQHQRATRAGTFGGTWLLSADGGQLTVTGGGNRFTQPATYFSSDWELTSPGVKKVTADDVVYEIERYQGGRDIKLPIQYTDGLPVREEVTVIHARVKNVADLVVTVRRVPQRPTIAAARCTLIITVTNKGPDPSGPITLVATLPDGIQATAPIGVASLPIGQTVVQLHLPSLGRDQSTAREVAFLVPPDHWPADTKEGFVAVPISATAPALDPDPSNNHVVEVVPLGGQ